MEIKDIREETQAILDMRAKTIQEIQTSLDEHILLAEKIVSEMIKAESEQDSRTFTRMVRAKSDEDITIGFYKGRLEALSDPTLPYITKNELDNVVTKYVEAFNKNSKIRRIKILKRIDEIIELSREELEERDLINETAAMLDFKAAKTRTYYNGTDAKYVGMIPAVESKEAAMYGNWLQMNAATVALKDECKAIESEDQQNAADESFRS